MGGNLDDILNDCLDRLARGEAVVDCVRRYPEHKEALTPLLQTAMTTMRVAQSITFRPEAKARGLQRLTAALAARRASKPSVIERFFGRFRLPRHVAVGMSAAAIATVVAVGTTAASSDAVPGDPLYWIKTTRENISLMMPKSDLDRARSHIRLAGIRGEEVGRLVGRGRLDEADRATARINHHINESAGVIGIMLIPRNIEMPYTSSVPMRGENATDLRRRLERHHQILRDRFIEMQQQLPPSEQQRLVVLRVKTEFGFRVFIAAIDARGGQANPPFWRTEPAR